MYFLLALCILLVESSDFFINTHHLKPITIEKSKGNFSVTAKNVPKSAFLIASYSRFTDFRIEYKEWVRNYKFYSIENYMNNTPTLYLSPSSYSKSLSITICSFRESIPRYASIELTYNSSSPSQSQCESPYKGLYCSINAKKISPEFSKTYSIPKFSNKFFYSNLLSSNYTLEIKVLSGNLHSFFKYNSKDILSSPASFLNTDNDLDSSKKSISFSANSDSDSGDYISLSVFCLDYKPCNFTVKYKSSEDGSNESLKYKIITIVLVVSACAIFVVLWWIWIGYRKKKKESPNESNEMIDKFFPLFTMKGQDKLKECSICFEDYQSNKISRKSMCGHIYHTECIQQWLLTNPCCPLCRSLINDQRI